MTCLWPHILTHQRRLQNEVKSISRDHKPGCDHLAFASASHQEIPILVVLLTSPIPSSFREVSTRYRRYLIGITPLKLSPASPPGCAHHHHSNHHSASNYDKQPYQYRSAAIFTAFAFPSPIPHPPPTLCIINLRRVATHSHGWTTAGHLLG